jgi:hypothetical protein
VSDPDEVRLWLYGTLEELKQLGFYEEEGGEDKPQLDQDGRRKYRNLVKAGFKPTYDEMTSALRRHFAADEQECVTALMPAFDAVHRAGMAQIKRARADVLGDQFWRD